MEIDDEEKEVESGLELNIVDALYDSLDSHEEPMILRKLSTTRIVQIELQRATYEVLEQERTKEFESMWLDDLERYESVNSMYSSQMLNKSQIATVSDANEQTIEQEANDSIARPNYSSQDR